MSEERPKRDTSFEPSNLDPAAKADLDRAFEELYRTLNMGIGMVVITDRPDEVQAAIDEPSWRIGEITTGERTVELVAG